MVKSLHKMKAVSVPAVNESNINPFRSSKRTQELTIDGDDFPRTAAEGLIDSLETYYPLGTPVTQKSILSITNWIDRFVSQTQAPNVYEKRLEILNALKETLQSNKENIEPALQQKIIYFIDKVIVQANSKVRKFDPANILKNKFIDAQVTLALATKADREEAWQLGQQWEKNTEQWQKIKEHFNKKKITDIFPIKKIINDLVQFFVKFINYKLAHSYAIIQKKTFSKEIKNILILTARDDAKSAIKNILTNLQSISRAFHFSDSAEKFQLIFEALNHISQYTSAPEFNLINVTFPFAQKLNQLEQYFTITTTPIPGPVTVVDQDYKDNIFLQAQALVKELRLIIDNLELQFPNLLDDINLANNYLWQISSGINNDFDDISRLENTFLELNEVIARIEPFTEKTANFFEKFNTLYRILFVEDEQFDLVDDASLSDESSESLDNPNQLGSEAAPKPFFTKSPTLKA